MYVERVYIQGHKTNAILNTLHDNPQLGVHTDVVLLGRDEGHQSPYFKRFAWVHHVRRPWGISTPVQCPSCGVLEKVRVAQEVLNVGVRLRQRCVAHIRDAGNVVRVCGWVNDVDVPASMAKLGRGEKGPQGNWVTIENATEEDFIRR